MVLLTVLLTVLFTVSPTVLFTVSLPDLSRVLLQFFCTKCVGTYLPTCTRINSCTGSCIFL